MLSLQQSSFALQDELGARFLHHIPGIHSSPLSEAIIHLPRSSESDSDSLSPPDMKSKIPQPATGRVVSPRRVPLPPSPPEDKQEVGGGVDVEEATTFETTLVPSKLLLVPEPQEALVPLAQELQEAEQVRIFLRNTFS